MYYLELGNSTLKLAQSIDDETLVLERFSSTDDLLKRLASANETIVCAPVGERHAKLAAELSRRPSAVLITREMLAPFVADSYDTPATLGIDRVLNLMGLSRDGIVISCGTAITVDALVDGRPLWGAIMSGFRTATQGLHARVSVLPEIDIERSPSMPARTSVGSVINGVVLGTALGAFGVAGELARASRVAEELPVTITGGDAQILERQWPATATPPVLDEMLTFAGMASLARTFNRAR